MRIGPVTVHRANRFDVGQRWRHQDIGPGAFVGLQPRNDLVEVLKSANESFAPHSQREAKADRPRGLGRRGNAFRGPVALVERAVSVAGKILDRAPDQPRLGRLRHGLRRGLGFVAEVVLKIGRNRKGDRVHDAPRMVQGLVARDLAVTPAERAGEAAARRRKRLKPQKGEGPQPSEQVVPQMDLQALALKHLDHRAGYCILAPWANLSNTPERTHDQPG